MLLHLLHLLLVGLGKRARHACARVHPNANAHKRLCSAGAVAAGSLHAARHGALHIPFAHGRIGKHRALVAHIDQLLGFLIIGNAGDPYSLDLHAAHLPPAFIQRHSHISGKLAPLGWQEADAFARRGKLVDGCLERLQKFV